MDRSAFEHVSKRLPLAARTRPAPRIGCAPHCARCIARAARRPRHAPGRVALFSLQRPHKMVKKENDTRGLADVEAYFNQIRTLLKQYRCVERGRARGGGGVWRRAADRRRAPPQPRARTHARIARTGCRRLVERLEGIKKDKKKADEKMDLLVRAPAQSLGTGGGGVGAASARCARHPASPARRTPPTRRRRSATA